MAAQVFTFHMVYAELEERIWRDVEVSSKMRLDQLGYVVLATFDTMAYHLFDILFRSKTYTIPNPDTPPEYLDLAAFTLDDLTLNVGEQMELIYDFGTEQHFLLKLIAARDMKRGEGRHFPWVIAMNGRGIIDDMSGEELAEIIRQIDKNGKTDEPVYYSRDGVDPGFLPLPWNINRFDLKTENCLLKYDVEKIEDGYAPFWEERRFDAMKAPAHKKQSPLLSDDELCRSFFDAVLCQDPALLRKLFRKDAVIEWPCTNECFSRDEYIRANCEYPGEWDGEINSILPAAEQVVLITKVWSKDKCASFHCVSVLRIKNGKITALTEYWSDDEPAPQWRREKGIGKQIETSMR